jgi:hypothetical protein
MTAMVAAKRGDKFPPPRSCPMPSSVIRAFAYDAAASRLEVTFRTGKRYAYADVPAAIADQLREAASKGEYFNAAIRDRFAFAKLR